MSMHLLGPAYNNIGKTVKKSNAKQARAKAEHDAWLRSQNIHPDQLSARSKSPRKLTKTVQPHSPGLACGNKFDVGGFKKSVFDSEWKQPYIDDLHMAEREAVALKQAQAKRSNVMQTYHKGPVMYASNLKMTELGKRR